MPQNNNSILVPQFENIPQAMKDESRWVCWMISVRNGKPTKLPIDPKTGQAASSTNPATWSDFESAVSRYQSDGLAGIGFCLGDGWLGVDLDDSVDADGTFSPLAEFVIDRLASYAELSPSGSGVHVVIRATLPHANVAHDRGIEVYADRRYLTVSGHHIEHTPMTVEARQSEVEELVASVFPQAKSRTGSAHAVHAATTSNSDHDTALAALDALSQSRADGYGSWLGVGMALNAVDSSDTMLSAWRDWSRQSDKFTDDCCDEKWQTFHGGGLSLGSLIHWARQDSPGWHPPTAYLRDDQTVDLSKIIPLPEEIEVEQFATAGNFPSDCLRPPGLLGDIISHNLRTALYAQPQFALGGALALMSVITGQKIEDENGSRTNAYILALGPSGSGKDHARKLNRDLLFRCGADHLIGPERLGSHAGLISVLNDQPVTLFQLDEVSRLLATMGDPKKAPHLYNIGSVLLTLFSSSGGMWTSDALADLKRVRRIDQPHAVIFGTATSHGFWESLTTDALTEGLIARFMIFEGEYVGFNERNQRLLPSDALLERVRAWVEMKGAGQGDLVSAGIHPVPHRMLYQADARKRLQDHMLSIVRRRMDEDPFQAAMWSRTAERSAKLALLFAASRWDGNGPLPMIEMQDINRGIQLSNWTTRRMLSEGHAHVAENAWDACVKRLYRLIRDKGPISASKLCSMSQGVRIKDRHEIIEHLFQTGSIDIKVEKTGGRSKTTYSIRHRVEESL